MRNCWRGKRCEALLPVFDLLPAALGDASLANLPPQAGLYVCLFGGLVFWLFCSSRHTVITVTSAISLLVGASLGEIAGGDTTRFGALAAGTALLVALIAFVAWLVRAGSIINFISESLMVGLKCGVAIFLASTQLPNLFGIHGAQDLSQKQTCSFVCRGGRDCGIRRARTRCPRSEVAGRTAGVVAPRTYLSSVTVVRGWQYPLK
jgi:Sulfate permease family